MSYDAALFGAQAVPTAPPKCQQQQHRFQQQRCALFLRLGDSPLNLNGLDRTILTRATFTLSYSLPLTLTTLIPTILTHTFSNHSAIFCIGPRELGRLTHLLTWL